MDKLLEQKHATVAVGCNNTKEFSSDNRFRPIVILTSNSEKDLPDAFLRGAFYTTFLFPVQSFDRVQNGLLQNSPGWQIIVGREFTLAIPMATLQLRR
jgi:hypothetical protein